MEVPGVIHASVGYTGRIRSSNDVVSTPATYETVCNGDGNTEAVRVVFNPCIVSYESIIKHFFENPRVPMIYGKQDVQYQVAVWVMDERQMMVAKEACEAAGKGDLPVYDFRFTEWYEGEESHQNFFGSIKTR